MRRAFALAGSLAAIAITACGGPRIPTPPPTATISLSPAPLGTPPTSSSPRSPGASPSPAAPGASVEAYPGLFSIIGDDGSGLTFRYDPETTAQVAADPSLADVARAVAIGLYTVNGQQPAEDFAIVSIVQVRAAEVDDEWFRDFRDSYDQAACAQAGGIARHAEAEMGTNHVFIGACAGGAFTYHVHAPNQPIVVSITSFGPERLGERLATSVGT